LKSYLQSSPTKTGAAIFIVLDKMKQKMKNAYTKQIDHMDSSLGEAYFSYFWKLATNFTQLPCWYLSTHRYILAYKISGAFLTYHNIIFTCLAVVAHQLLLSN